MYFRKSVLLEVGKDWQQYNHRSNQLVLRRLLNAVYSTPHVNSQALFKDSITNPGKLSHLRASAASAEAAASAATSAAATAAAAALFRVASNLWIADTSAVGPLLLPGGWGISACYSQTEAGSFFLLCSYGYKRKL